MGVDALLVWLETLPATSATSENPADVAAKPLPCIAVTSVTSATSSPINAGARALFCTVCGPIYANTKPPTHAGQAYGMPIVSSCEWCRVGERPHSRPKVACSTCKHFERVDLNKISGPGNCAAGAVADGLAHRVAALVCGTWAPSRVST